MFGIGPIEMLIVGILFLVLIAGGFVLLGVGMKGLRGFRFGHATLNCPHCGAETPAADGKCRHCGKSFT